MKMAGNIRTLYNTPSTYDMKYLILNLDRFQLLLYHGPDVDSPFYSSSQDIPVFHQGIHQCPRQDHRCSRFQPIQLHTVRMENVLGTVSFGPVM